MTIANNNQPHAEGSLKLDDLPNIDASQLQPIDTESLIAPNDPRHPPKILVLYGSLRERSFSRLAAEEASRLLRWYGCEVQMFNPSGLPLPDDADSNHPKVQELRELAQLLHLWVIAVSVIRQRQPRRIKHPHLAAIPTQQPTCLLSR